MIYPVLRDLDPYLAKSDEAYFAEERLDKDACRLLDAAAFHKEDAEALLGWADYDADTRFVDAVQLILLTPHDKQTSAERAIQSWLEDAAEKYAARLIEQEGEQ